MDVIARVPDCDGQAAYVKSAYTQVKLEDDPRLSKFQSQNVQTYGYDLPRRVLETQFLLLKETCKDILLQDSCGRDNSTNLIGTKTGKSTELGMSVRSQKTIIIPNGICG